MQIPPAGIRLLDARRLMIIVLVALNALYAPAHAELLDTENTTADTTVNSNTKAAPLPEQTLPEVSVSARRIEDERIDTTRAITTITTEDLERLQPATLFDAIRDVPSVAINGGPRPSGMSFNIRGYADNEDLAVKVDGIPKGFEKYRMGGTFLEPELLKSVEVQRGPQITSGSGSLGGTIIATTKDAADLLQPGQRYGARAKFGYANNNDEYSRSYMVYGRPDDRIDILFNYSNRQSNDIMQPGGVRLESSAISSISKLLKVSVFPSESVQLTTSVVSFEDSGLQPYDATGGQPGTFGNVIRSIEDLTWSETLHYRPDNRWVDFKAIFGKGYTDLHDLIRPGMSSINPLCTPILCRGNLNDYYRYETTNLDISNRSRMIENKDWSLELLLGLQYNKNEREVSRYYDNTAYSQSFYPNGFNASAPPGTKSYVAYYLQPKLSLGRLSIMPGFRKDFYQVEAAGGTLALLEQYDQASTIKFRQESYSLGLAYALLPQASNQQLTLYSNYGQGFRPPLVDEYFTQGVFSRCLRAFTSNGPASQICGELYRPQTSESTEAGISYQTPRLFGSDIQLTSKLNFFHIRTSHLLTSLRQNDAGEIVQDGWERRNGVEFESTMSAGKLYGRVSYSRISGALFDGKEYVPLYTVPGNALNITLGANLHARVDANISYRRVAQRTVVTAGGGSIPLEFGTQDGYEVFNAGIHWAPTSHMGFRLIGENLANKEYRLDGAFGGTIGNVAPGRNIRIVAEFTY
jgi:hemoglobin/transferrin/lactoferrin receptor protein